MRLYEPKGFKKLLIYQNENEWVNYSHMYEKDVPAITKKIGNEDINWWPMVLLPHWLQVLKPKLESEDITSSMLHDVLYYEEALTDKYIGNYQFDSLFPYFIKDLESNNSEVILNSIQSITQLLKSFLSHHNYLYNYELIERVSSPDEIVWLAENSYKIINELTEKIAKYVNIYEDKSLQKLAYLIGYILSLDIGDIQYINFDKFFKECVVPLIQKGDFRVNQQLFAALNKYNSRTPQVWLKNLDAPSLTTSIHFKMNEFSNDPEKLKRMVNSLRLVLFNQGALGFDTKYDPWLDISNSFRTLKTKHPTVIKNIFILAAAKQKRLNQLNEE